MKCPGSSSLRRAVSLIVTVQEHKPPLPPEPGNQGPPWMAAVKPGAAAIKTEAPET